MGTVTKIQWCDHKQLVRRIAHWAKHTRRMTIVIAELSTRSPETPDVIAWSSELASSLLVECKVSRADFRRDRQKHFRQHEQLGMGDQRYFAAPTGVLTTEDMPDGWGLMEVDGRGVHVTQKAEWKTANKRNEVVMLVSVPRRLEIATAVFVREAKSEEEN